MMNNVERLAAGDLKELLRFLNRSFKDDPECGYFEKGLPKLWVDDNEHMRKHYVIRESGSIVAVVGVYPFDVTIEGEHFRFATVGNVAVSAEHRGNGYLHEFYTMANQILEAENIDVARLGGLRSRYERYGYEPCAFLHKASITRRNAAEYVKEKSVPAYTFRAITEKDTEILALIRNLYEKNSIFANRGANAHEFYLSSIAWDNTVWAAFLPDGHFAGYLCADRDKTWSSESAAITAEHRIGMLCRFLLETENSEIMVHTPPDRIEEITLISSFCEQMCLDIPSSFKVLNWEKLISALLRMKNRLTSLPDGSFVLQIQDFGNYRIAVENGNTICEKTDLMPDMSLSRLTASRFLFGPMPPYMTAPVPTEKAVFASAVFPLPMYWHNQDRA